MIAAPSRPSDLRKSFPQDKHRRSSLKSSAGSSFDQPTAYRMWFRDLLWRAFPASSDAARAERAARQREKANEAIERLRAYMAANPAQTPAGAK